MTEKTFHAALITIAVGFGLFFVFTVIPPLAQDWDLIGAIAGGFVNPFAAGYSTDVILCWFILALWVLHERRTLHIKYGWLCVLLGLVPGVAVGFALYLILRARQIRH